MPVNFSVKLHPVMYLVTKYKKLEQDYVKENGRSENKI